MKKAKIIMAVLGVLFALVATVSASSGIVEATLHYRGIKVTLNGEQIQLVDASGVPVEPFIIDGTTYLPLRAIANGLGLMVGWDGATSTVILAENKTEDTVRHMVYITKTGKRYHYDETCNGATYWPVPYETAIGLELTPCEKCVWNH